MLFSPMTPERQPRFILAIYSISNLLSTHLISTLYYWHVYGKDIHEKPTDCALIHMIDDVILFVLKEQAISLRLSLVSFMLRRLGIWICIMFRFVHPYQYVKHITKSHAIRSSKTKKTCFKPNKYFLNTSNNISIYSQNMGEA